MLQARGIKGASNSSKLDREIWDEFYGNIETVAFESELLRAKKELRTADSIMENEPDLSGILAKEIKDSAPWSFKPEMPIKCSVPVISSNFNNSFCLESHP